MAKDKTGNIRDAVKFCGKHKDGASAPMVAEAFGRSQSTADNWLRSAADRGFLKVFRPQPGDYQGQQGHVGRPPCLYEITAKGSKFVESPEAKAIPQRTRDDLDGPRKAKAEAKPKKAKAEAKPKKAKAEAKRALTPEQRAAKNAKDKARRAAAKAPKTPAAPEAEAPSPDAG
jgi:predicted ArsR family transcriptional regulator